MSYGTNEHVTIRTDTPEINEKIGKLSKITEYYIDLKNPPSPLLGVTGTGDETSKVQSIISSIPAGKTTKLFLSDLTINVSSDLDLPVGFSLVGRNATINLQGALNLRGNTVLEGLVIDGKSSSKSVFLYGTGNRILNNTFKNFRASTAAETNCIFVNASSTGNIIKENTFDTIQAYSENGTVGDAVGSARAILSYGGCTIRDNVFKNMIGYEDADYICISGDTLTDTAYPFNLLDARGYLDVSIYNNEFYQSCKASIKIMASGVKCFENTIHMYETDIAKTPYSAIRTHRTIGVVIENNRIDVNVQRLFQIIITEYTRNCIVKGNVVEILYDAPDNTNQTFIFASFCQTPKLFENTITKKNGNYRAFRIENSKDVEVGYNTITCKTTVTNATSCMYFLSNDNVVVSYNTVFDGNNGLIYAESCTNLSFTKNNFQNTTFSFKSCTGVDTEKNKLNQINTVANLYWFILDNISDFNCLKNNVKGSYASFLRISTPSTAIKMLANDVFGTASNEIINLFNNASQVMSEIQYSPGVLPLQKYDYGTTAQRPTFSRYTGYRFFDTTLSKTVTWNGSNWLDAAGANA